VTLRDHPTRRGGAGRRSLRRTISWVESLFGSRSRPAASGFDANETPPVAFVTCIERGPLEAQALLLYESIRRFGGAFSRCPIYAFSPRAGYAISTDTRRRLKALSVEWVDAELNRELAYFPFANKPFAAAYVEALHRHEVLVTLDSDTIFLAAPTAIDPRATDVDVWVRPVDVRGICTTGGDDAYDPYWRRLCETCGVNYDQLPWMETAVDRVRVKACYQSGLVAVRGDKGIFRRWRDFLIASLAEGQHTLLEASRAPSSTGRLDPRASRVWGADQACLALAIWRSTSAVRLLEAAYDYPLHLHERMDPQTRARQARELVHVHYHWLFNAEYDRENPLASQGLRLQGPAGEWLRRRLPMTSAGRV